MIRLRSIRQTVDTIILKRDFDFIERSGAAGMIDDAHKQHAGGRPPTGIRYNVAAMLTAMRYLMEEDRAVATVAACLDLLVCRTTVQQRDMLGLSATPEQVAAVTVSQEAWTRECGRATEWLAQKLAPLDAHPDVPARKGTVGEKKSILAARSRQMVQECKDAQARCDAVVNALVAASVEDPAPDGYYGDLVVDESTFDVSSRGVGMGARPTSKRPAVPLARVYSRSGGIIPYEDKPQATVSKTAAGIGVTALVRMGEPTTLRKVPRAVTAIIVRHVTAANIEALDAALTAHAANGFDPRTSQKRGANARWPRITADRAYPYALDWAPTLRRHRYDGLGRLSDSETLTSVAESDRPGGRPPGPIMVEGTWLCPAARGRRHRKLGVSTREHDSTSAWDAHDTAIRQRMDLAMGINGRVQERKKPGRPSKTEPDAVRLRQALICPARQGRVRCPLAPDSMKLDPGEVNTIAPTWGPDEYESCSRMHVTVTLNAKQAKHHQVMPIGSWEHTLAHEAYRAYNEQTFSVVKSRVVSAISTNYGPRREPWLKIMIGMAFAIGNATLQRAHVPAEVDTYTERWQQLTARLGREPAKIPPRT